MRTELTILIARAHTLLDEVTNRIDALNARDILTDAEAASLDRWEEWRQVLEAALRGLEALD